MCSLLDAFTKFKNGEIKSKRYEKEHKDEITKESTEKNKKNKDKAKKIKEDLKEPCGNCNGTGEVEGYRCTQCLGRGYIKKRKIIKFKKKQDIQKESKLIGKKKAKKIQTMFFNGLTIKDISDKINIEEYLIKQVIQDLKDKLEQSLNRNN